MLVWASWLVWIALESYMLGMPDYKFGRDWGFLFGAGLKGLAALISATIALLIHSVESRTERALPQRERLFVIVICGLVLAGLTVFVPSMYLPMDWLIPQPNAVFAELGVPWALLSAVVILIALAGTRIVRNLTLRSTGRAGTGLLARVRRRGPPVS